MPRNLNFRNAIEAGKPETNDLPGCSITGVSFPGEHSGLDIRTRLCCKVKLDGVHPAGHRCRKAVRSAGNRLRVLHVPVPGQPFGYGLPGVV